jgi:hypothetical protein
MYSFGGADATLTTVYSICDKTSMCAETTAAASTGSLSSNRYGAASAANPGVAGYICSGNTSTTTWGASGDKLLFSNDTTSAVSTANLSTARGQIAAQSERSTKCYFAGGLNAGGKLATADKLLFTNDTAAATGPANLSTARAGVAGSNGNSSKGYWTGGTPTTATNAVVTGEKLTYSSDTTAATASVNLSAKRENQESGGDGSTKAYWFAGQIGLTIGNVDKTTVSTDTTAATTTATGSNVPCFDAASGSDGNKLFAMGGVDSTGNRASGSKITFATDVSVALAGGASLSQSRQFVAGLTTVAL